MDTLCLDSVAKCNNNGLLLLLCQEIGLALANTWFKEPDKFKASCAHGRPGHWHTIDYVVVRCKDMFDVKSVCWMRGAECWTDDRVFGDKKKMRNFGPKASKYIDVSQMVCVETFQHFQSAVLSIYLVGSPDPVDADAK